MWMVVKVQGTEVLRDVLDRWKASIDAQQPERVAEVVAAFGEVLGEGGQFIARSYYPGLSFEASAEMIELLGEVRRLL